MNGREYYFSSTVFAALVIVAGSSSSYLRQCIDEYCFETPGLDLSQTMDIAKGWCLGRSSQLVTATDFNAQAALARFLKSYKMGPTFLDAKLRTNPINTWYLVNGLKYLGGVLNQFYGSYEQYVLYGSLVMKNGGFHVEAARPTSTKGYICSFNASECRNFSDGDKHVESGLCFVKTDNVQLTWFKARERCFDQGGDLATFNFEDGSYSDYKHPLNTSVWLNPSMAYWVGILYKHRVWKSLSDSDKEIIYTNWSYDKPSNHSAECICLDPNGDSQWSWTDCLCDERRQFVCLTDVSSLSTTALTDPNGTLCETLPPQSQLQGTDVTVSNLVLVVGLVLGVGVIVPLLIVITILIIIHLRLRRNTRESSRFEEVTERPAKIARESQKENSYALLMKTADSGDY